MPLTSSGDKTGGAAVAPPADAGVSTVQWTTLSGEPPVVIAHRGASGLRPEHTIEAYSLAVDQGADWIEPDLVLTRDGVLIARHDRYLSTTTDVADRPEFADRKREKSSGGEPRMDWWAEDFTLEEIKTLRARQSFPGRSKEFDGQFTIPTFAEVAALAKARSTPNRVIGVMPEIKQPGALDAFGFRVAAILAAAFKEQGWTDASAPLILQSFEPEVLVQMKERLPVRRVQLVFPQGEDTGALRSNIPLPVLATYADSVGPNKALIVSPSGEATDFVTQAHALGLKVFPWTFRDDAPALDGVDAETELMRAYQLGVDGLFTDFPETAVRVRDTM